MSFVLFAELFVEEGPDAAVPIPPLGAESTLLLLRRYDPHVRGTPISGGALVTTFLSISE